MKIALFSALLITSSPLIAAPKFPAPGSENYACDVPGGRFDQYQRHIGSGATEVRALISINEMRTDTNWFPVVNVTVNTPVQRVGLRIVVSPNKKLANFFAVFPSKDGEIAQPLGAGKPNGRYAVHIKTDAQSSSVEVAGMKHDGPGLVGADKAISLSCSSIDAHISELTIKSG